MSDDGFEEKEESGSGLMSYLPLILWQRRWLFIVPAVLLTLAGIAAAFLLPTIYRSSATLLVESQELPADVVGSPVTAVIDQRIAKIRQRVLSRGDLISLIQQNDLYPEERKSKPMSDIVEKMKGDTDISAVNADIGQKQGSTTTIAFSMSFDYPDPVKAQLVMQSFVDSFLKIDAAAIAQQAGSTVEFLGRQATELQGQIAAIEGRITAIKAKNGSALASTGMQAVSNSGSYDAQIASLQRDNAIALQQNKVVTKDPVVAQAETQLAAARAIYSENHPDVRIARQRLEEAKRLAASNQNDNRSSLISAQIAANNAQIAELARLRAAESARSSTVSSAQAKAPVVQEEVAQLESKATALRTQLEDVNKRLAPAQNSARMASQDKGERLAVTEPPIVPEKPLSPNRPKLIAGGFAGGLFAGFLLVMAMEIITKPLRGIREIEKITGMRPIAVIPELKFDGGSRVRGDEENAEDDFGDGRRRLRDRLIPWSRRRAEA